MILSSLRHGPDWRRAPALGSLLGFSLFLCPLTALARDADAARGAAADDERVPKGPTPVDDEDYHELADGAEDAERLSLAAGVQALYGSPPSENLIFPNPFGLGLGVRVALTLPSAIYVGASYEHFFGGPPVEWASSVAVRNEASLDQVTAWGGYQLPLDGVTLRPGVGLGYARAVSEGTATELDGDVEHSRESDGYVIVSPAMVLAFPVGAALFLVEGRYTFVPEQLADDVLMVAVGVELDIL